MLSNPNKPFAPEVDPAPYFEWLIHIPPHLRKTLQWKESYSWEIPSGTILLLYAGKGDHSALEVAIHRIAPEQSQKVIAIDTCRDGCSTSHNMLSQEPYNSLCTAAAKGKIRIIAGGPNCRTWSVCLLVPKPGGGIPVRGRSEKECWGLNTNSSENQTKCDEDSTLILRMMYLLSLASLVGSEMRSPIPT